MTTPERLRRRQRIESALIAVLCFLLAGGTFVVWLNERGDDELLAGAVADIREQADRNGHIIDCLTTYADGLTDALQDRDVVLKTARVAAQEVWDTFRRLISTETPPPNARQTMIDAIVRYQRILARLQRTDAINPYPDIANCLRQEAVAAAAAYRFVASSYRLSNSTCFGRAVTVRGSSDDDVIHGTDKADVIKGFGGGDIIHGGKGRDLICGGRGGDTINGGKDYDRARGQKGSDFCVQVESPRSC